MVSLLDFTSELMTRIYHLKNIAFCGAFGCFFCFVFVFFQTGPLVGHSGLGIYHGDTLTCLNFTALAAATGELLKNIRGSGPKCYRVKAVG